MEDKEVRQITFKLQIGNIFPVVDLVYISNGHVNLQLATEPETPVSKGYCQSGALCEHCFESATESANRY